MAVALLDEALELLVDAAAVPDGFELGVLVAADVDVARVEEKAVADIDVVEEEVDDVVVAAFAAAAILKYPDVLETDPPGFR